MIRYFFRVEVRSISRDRYISLLKIAGLMLGFTVVFIIGQHILHEISYDNFQSKASKKFLLQEKRWFGNYFYDNTSPYPLGQYIKEACPEAEDVASFMKISNEGFIKTRDGFLKLGLNEIVFVEPSFFSFFSFDFLAGNPDELLKTHNPAIISRRIADKFFSGEEALGKTVEMLSDNIVLEFTISGIFETPPANTNFNFEWIGAMHHIKATLDNNNYTSDWEFTNENYILLKDETNNEAFLNKIASFYQSNAPENITRTRELRMINIQHLNLTPEVKKRLILLGSLAILILAISVINFILLSFARDTQKMNQSVLENISGARNKDIFIKHLISSTIPIFLAIILSLLLIYLMDPYIPVLFSLNFGLYDNLIGLTALILTLGLMASFIVAGAKSLLMSSYTPADLLRNKFKSGKLGVVIRNSLMTFQLLTFIALLSITIVMQKQLEFIQSTDLGFNKEHLITLKLSENDKKMFPILKDELTKISGIKSISGTDCPPVANHREIFGTMETDNAGNQILKQIEYVNVDKDYFQTMEMSLLDGVGFTSYQKGICLVNEALIKEKGIEEPIGHQIEVGGNTYIISGILKNFHQHSLHENINPFIIFLKSDALSYVLIRLHPGNMSSTIAVVKSISAQVLPQTPLEINFLDDAIRNQYEKEQRSRQMFIILSLLAIAIACFGLLGISHLTSLQRTKEIGIRKVNGAKIWQVMLMLNRDFVKWVAIAFVIATPIAYYAMNKWLQSFAYKTEMSWWIFALSGLLALGIALLTVSWQSWRAARRNPVEALRYE